MGQKRVRIVLDTNVLVSALILRGPTNRLVSLWREGRIILLVSKDVLLEYLRVLSYPKFAIPPNDIKKLVEETVLPFSETVTVLDKTPIVADDPPDDKFLFLALDGRAGLVLSGDRYLLSLGEYRGMKIISAGRFLEDPDFR